MNFIYENTKILLWEFDSQNGVKYEHVHHVVSYLDQPK